jgi:hypothetical protein
LIISELDELNQKLVVGKITLVCRIR